MNLDNTLECSHPFKHWELSKCLDRAFKQELIEKNPVKLIDKPKIMIRLINYK